MRHFAVALAAVVVLSGCLSGIEDPENRAEPGPIVEKLVRAAPFTVLSCGAGDMVPLRGGPRADCNFHVTNESGPAAEVFLAANPLDPRNLVGGSKDFSLGEDERCGKYNVWSGVHVSHDGGRSWNHSLLPGYPGDERKTALSDYACGSDPVVAFAPNGTAYYASIHAAYLRAHEVAQLSPVLGYDAGPTSLAVTRSRDGGDTWDDPVIVAARTDGQIIDKEWLAIDPDGSSMYVSYSVSGALWVQRSDDGAATWSEPVAAVRSQDPPDGPNAMQFAQIGVTADHVVHMIHWSVNEAGQVTAVVHRSSPDRGETWGEPHHAWFYAPVLDLGVTHKYRIVPMPALATDSRSGVLYVVIPVVTLLPPISNLDLVLVASKDGGKTWELRAIVNDDSIISPLNMQWMPAIAVGPDGTVHMTWIDYRDDPTAQFAHVYYANYNDSRPAGEVVSENARITTVPFDGTGGYHQSGAGTIGDYMGIAVSEEAVVPFWADTRYGRNDVFSAIILGAAAP